VSKDISRILAEWDFDDSSVNVRSTQADDGRELIQLRLDLGLLQMEVDGRPDGLRPENCESWLEYYEQQRDKVADGESFSLNHEDCARLLREGVQFYHRYLSFWHLRRYDLCARDTARNLRLFAFVRQHAQHERDKLQFDQWRPYVTMMHTRAVATPQIEAGNFAAALRAIDAGIKGVRQFLTEYKQVDRADQCGELTFLLRMRGEVAAQQSQVADAAAADPLTSLRSQLARAVAQEKFEEAARLRDEIRRLSTPAGPSTAEGHL
jgi:hypothetical protein